MPETHEGTGAVEAPPVEIRNLPTEDLIVLRLALQSRVFDTIRRLQNEHDAHTTVVGIIEDRQVRQVRGAAHTRYDALTDDPTSTDAERIASFVSQAISEEGLVTR
jgi:hypothetical protein